MKVLISGAGIGGLTAGLCCLHHGHEVTIFEQAPELGEVGAGIQVPPNAMKVFRKLGIDGLITEKAFKPQSIEARMGESGQRLFSIPLQDAAERNWGAPYLHIHRADYVAALAAAFCGRSGAELRFGSEIVSYQQSASGVELDLADGSRASGDVLIGADGIHSAVRTQMLGDDAPVFTGNVAWRAVVPVAALGALAPPPTTCAWMGRGRHCVTYLLRNGRLANLVAVIEKDDWTGESWSDEGSRDEAYECFAGWDPTILKMIEQAEVFHRWALFDRAPLSSWTDGRVALLGDAAHPMLPFLAQGAAMAVEDAWALAASLSTPRISIEQGLKVYQLLRFKRASKVQARSRRNAQTFHQRTRLGQIRTYGPMWLAGRVAPTLVRRLQDGLYGYDVTRI